jgi:glycosyltransferase involved in cell wall biosynthesis
MNVANGFWLPILKLAGVPTLVNVDGMEWLRAKWGTIAKAVFYWGARATARFATRRVYDSLEIERRWKAEFRPGEGIFIPYGGDVTPELPIEPGLSRRGYVLVVARLVPENSIGEFFDIVPELAEQYPVVIVGSAGYGGELDERARQLSRLSGVTWLGHIRDDIRLASLWQHAGAYFHGHTVGGTNPALVQAMACGAPVVARGTVYNREVLGDAGLFAESKDDIMKQIVRLLNDNEIATTLVNRAINRAREHYSWDLVCNRYLQNLVALAKA